MEDPVAFPEVQAVDLSLRNPLQSPLIAVCQLTCKAICRVEENVLHLLIVIVVYKSQDTPEPVVCERQTGLLLRLPEDTVLRTLPAFKLSADADPFVLIDVMFLFDPVDHQIFFIFFDITKSCKFHCVPHSVFSGSVSARETVLLSGDK